LPPTRNTTSIYIVLGTVNIRLYQNTLSINGSNSTPYTSVNNILSVYFDKLRVNAYLGSTSWYSQAYSTGMISLNIYADAVSTLDQFGSLAFTDFNFQPIVLGPRGTMIYSGNGAPTSLIGAAGDFYLDLLTGKLYGPFTG
jgi:hypothetical protein